MSTRTNISKPSGTARIMRECRVDDRLKQSTANTRAVETRPKKVQENTKLGARKITSGVTQTQPCKRKTNLNEETRPHAEISDRNSKTWFQVLLESPKKSKPSKILLTSRQQNPEAACRCKSASNDIHETEKSENTKRFNLLVDMLFERIGETNDKDFLKIVNVLRTLLDDPNHPYFEKENRRRPNPLTDDDKRNFQKPAVESDAGQSKNTSDLLLKALLRETKDQREVLQNLNVQLAQLREENRMLSQLKDARMTLESKLASRSTEMKYLRREHEKMKRLLEMRDRENEDLKNRLSILKIAANGKMNHLFDNFDDHSIELIANPPSHETSFDMPIRPASSSPTEGVRTKDTRAQKPFASPKTNSDVIQAEGTSVRVDLRNDTKLNELKADVKKLTEALEADLADANANDISLNLSDVTYKWSI